MYISFHSCHIYAIVITLRCFSAWPRDTWSLSVVVTHTADVWRHAKRSLISWVCVISFFRNNLITVVSTRNRCPQVDWQQAMLPQQVARVELVPTSTTCCRCCESVANLHYKVIRSMLQETGNKSAVCSGKLVANLLWVSTWGHLKAQTIPQVEDWGLFA